MMKTASRIRRFALFTAVFLMAIWPAGAENNDMLAGQPRSEYQARRQRLMERVKDGIVVLVGAREEDFGEVGRFRQKNDFMYLTGVETPAAYLLLVPAGLIPGTPAQEVLFIPPRNPAHERWNGPQLGPGPEAVNASGIASVVSSQEFKSRLESLLSKPPFKVEGGQKAAKVYTVVPSGATAPMTREHHFIEQIRAAAPHAEIANIAPIIAEMRKVKSASEVIVLQRAIDITNEGHLDIARMIRPGLYEYEVQATLEYALARNGAERPGFPSIVGSGIYSTVLHYNANRKKIEPGDLIVVDIGAEYSYYTADITRTYPATGKFTPRQREIYELVLEAQRAAERAYKPGATIFQLEQAAREVMKASKLHDRQGNTLDRYFIHGLSHWLGMDVHDVGSYGGPIPVGAVFTIEPGIYIPEEKLGVRIEDDYLVTATGLVKLSRRMPSDPDEIEILMASRGQNTTPGK